jgi:hypothetical protein
MPPNLARKVKRDDVPLYAVSGERVRLMAPTPITVEPSPMLAAILEYLERA